MSEESIVEKVVDLAALAKSETLACSFCGRTQKQVKVMIVGPDVYICDECVVSSAEMIVELAAAEVGDPAEEETLP